MSKKGLIGAALGLGAAAVACVVKAMKPDYIETEGAETDVELIEDETVAEVEAE